MTSKKSSTTTDGGVNAHTVGLRNAAPTRTASGGGAKVSSRNGGQSQLDTKDLAQGADPHDESNALAKSIALVLYELDAPQVLPKGATPPPEFDRYTQEEVDAKIFATAMFLGLVVKKKRLNWCRDHDSHAEFGPDSAFICISGLSLDLFHNRTVDEFIDRIPAINRWFQAWVSTPARKPDRNPDWASGWGYDEGCVNQLVRYIRNEMARPRRQRIEIRSPGGRRAILEIPAKASLTTVSGALRDGDVVTVEIVERAHSISLSGRREILYIANRPLELGQDVLIPRSSVEIQDVYMAQWQSAASANINDPED